jgi:pimeloyl-ACP methyl ester carboxylesterase
MIPVATVIADIASYLPPDTLAGVAYLAPCPFIGDIMLSMGTPFILSLLNTLATSDDALTQERSLDAFADACFKDPAAIDWRLRTSWRGMASFCGREQRRFVTTRAQDPTALFSLVSGKSVHPATRETVPALPTMVIIGKDDSQIFADKLETAMRQHFRDLDFVVLPNRGHSIHVECEDDVMERVLAFGRRVFALPDHRATGGGESDACSSTTSSSDVPEDDGGTSGKALGAASYFPPPLQESRPGLSNT